MGFGKSEAEHLLYVTLIVSWLILPVALEAFRSCSRSDGDDSLIGGQFTQVVLPISSEAQHEDREEHHQGDAGDDQNGDHDGAHWWRMTSMVLAMISPLPSLAMSVKKRMSSINVKSSPAR